MGYLNELTSLGFISTYLLTCIAAQFFLRRGRMLRWYHVLSSLVALGIFGFALAGTIYPTPPAPWNLLPFIFMGAVAVGFTLSWILDAGSAQSEPVLGACDESAHE